MKHTPGPWIIEEDQRIDGADHVIETNGNAVAFIATGRKQEEHAANARLIAAAPDLYAELENIALATPDLWENPSHFRAWAQHRARHALTKARGES